MHVPLHCWYLRVSDGPGWSEHAIIGDVILDIVVTLLVIVDEGLLRVIVRRPPKSFTSLLELLIRKSHQEDRQENQS